MDAMRWLTVLGCLTANAAVNAADMRISSAADHAVEPATEPEAVPIIERVRDTLGEPISFAVRARHVDSSNVCIRIAHLAVNEQASIPVDAFDVPAGMTLIPAQPPTSK